MTIDLITPAILAAATLLGALVQAATGFGFALIAAPAFLTAMNSSAALQVLVALHIVQSAMVVPGLSAQAPRGMLIALCAGSIVGFPLGLAVFLRLDVQTLKLMIGMAMLMFTMLLLAREYGLIGNGGASDGRGRAHSPWLIATVGMASGFLTAVLVMPGPPLILYLMARGASKDISRAAALTFFAFCYVVVTALHVAAGGMGLSEWRSVLFLAPVVIVGTMLGTAVATRLTDRWFRNAVYAVLVLSGSYAVWSSL